MQKHILRCSVLEILENESRYHEKLGYSRKVRYSIADIQYALYSNDSYNLERLFQM